MSRIDSSIVATGEVNSAASQPGSPSDEALAQPIGQAMDMIRATRREAEAQARLDNLRYYGNGALGDPTFGRALREKIQLPGESKHGFTLHRAAIMRDFAPASSVEITLLESFIRADWELVRHRFLKDAALFKATRARIEAWVTRRMAEGLEDQARSDKVADGAADGAAAHEASPKYWSQVRRVEQVERLDRRAVTQEVERILRIVLDVDPENPDDAYLDLVDAGLVPSDLLSDACLNRSEAARCHDEEIRTLEDRRSGLLDDWMRFRKTTHVLSKN